jgi:hypothetical protein
MSGGGATHFIEEQMSEAHSSFLMHSSPFARFCSAHAAAEAPMHRTINTKAVTARLRDRAWTMQQR